MKASDVEPPGECLPDRWELLRDAVVFQGKLFLDGIRDVVMGPVSLAAALLDLLGLGGRAGLHFYDAIRFGRRTEEWINLFGAADRVDRLPESGAPEDAGLDRLVRRMESLVVQEYERGGITRSAKETVDRALDRVQGKDGGAGG